MIYTHRCKCGNESECKGMCPLCGKPFEFAVEGNPDGRGLAEVLPPSEPRKAVLDNNA